MQWIKEIEAIFGYLAMNKATLSIVQKQGKASE